MEPPLHNNPQSSMLKLLFFLAVSFFGVLDAQGYLFYTLPSSALQYFNVTFELQAYNDLPKVTCKVTCPGGFVSAVTAQMTTDAFNISVPVPSYGNCIGTVEATNMTIIPNQKSLPVYNYTQCQVTTISTPTPFNTSTNATVMLNYTNSGPVGAFYLELAVQPQNASLTYDAFQTQISKDSISQTVYQSSCTGSNTLTIGYSDGSPTTLADCAAYSSTLTIFKPYQPFYNLYGTQAQGSLNVTTFLSSSSPAEAMGSVTRAVGSICLMTSYVVVQPSEYIFVPNSTFTFTTYLGVPQSMTVKGAANFNCDSGITFTSFNLSSSPQSVTVNTPDTPINSTCYLYVNIDPEADSYAAPAKIFLNATDAPVITTSSQLVTESTMTEVTTSDITSAEITTEVTTAETSFLTSEVFTTEEISTSDSFSTETLPTSTEASSVESISSSSDPITTVTTSEPFTITTSQLTTTIAPVITTTLILSASPATPTAGGIVTYAVYFNPPSIEPVTMQFSCNSSATQSFVTATSESKQTFIVDSFAIGQCELQASNINYDSNIVQLIVNQQLYFYSSLTGWMSGQSVPVNISSANLEQVTLSLVTTCSIGSFSESINASTDSLYPIAGTVNGVQCSLSASGMPPYYLAFPATFVNVAIDSQQIPIIVQQLNPAVFIRFLDNNQAVI